MCMVCIIDARRVGEGTWLVGGGLCGCTHAHEIGSWGAAGTGRHLRRGGGGGVASRVNHTSHRALYVYAHLITSFLSTLRAMRFSRICEKKGRGQHRLNQGREAAEGVWVPAHTLGMAP